MSTVIGAGSGNSAISGERIVENLANRLQMPKAVAPTAVGNIYGVAKYEILKASAIPDLANKTNIAIKAPSALKNITRKRPPTDASKNDIINDSLTPNLSMTIPEPV